MLFDCTQNLHFKRLNLISESRDICNSRIHMRSSHNLGHKFALCPIAETNSEVISLAS